MVLKISAGRLGLAALVTLVIGWGIVPAVTLSAGPALRVLQFNVDTGLPGATVSSDGFVPAAPQYSDHRFPGQAESCVETEEMSKGSFFIRLNRQTGAGRCDEFPQSPDGAGDARQVVILVDDQVACQELAAYDADYVEWVGDSGTAPCRLTGSDNPRIRVENIYSTKLPGSATIDFLISSFSPDAPNHGGFELRSNGKGLVTGTATHRTLEYAGTSSLWKYDRSVKTGPAITGGPVTVRLKFTFQQTTF